MYGMYTYIEHKNQPNVGKYIHHTWILWDIDSLLTITEFRQATTISMLNKVRCILEKKHLLPNLKPQIFMNPFCCLISGVSHFT